MINSGPAFGFGLFFADPTHRPVAPRQKKADVVRFNVIFAMTGAGAISMGSIARQMPTNISSYDVYQTLKALKRELAIREEPGGNYVFVGKPPADSEEWASIPQVKSNRGRPRKH